MALHRLDLDRKHATEHVVFTSKDSTWVQKLGGKPLLARYTPRKATLFGTKSSADLYLTVGTPIVTERAWKALSPVLGAHVGALPLDAPGPKRFILNVLTRADDAIDLARSRGNSIGVHADKVPAVPIFGIARANHVETLVDDSVKTALAKAKLKGWRLEGVAGAPKGKPAGAAPASKKDAPASRVEGESGSIVSSWKAIHAWEKKSALSLSLAPGASAAAIAKLERAIGAPLPADVALSLRTHDGQRNGAITIDEWTLLSCKDIEREWNIWKSIAGELASLRSVPARGVRDAMWSTRWIPLTGNGAGDHLCADLDPAPKGTAGQIITVWHAAPERERIASSFGAWLGSIAKKLSAGRLTYSEEDHALVD
jgi:cell wall assembly regulator SMI1